MSQWRWGAEHVALLQHKVYSHVPLLDRVSDLWLPSSGDFYTLDRGGGFEAPADQPFARTQGGGFRGLYDLADPDKSRFMITTGQSGHIFSPHYRDLAPLWIDGKSITIAGERGRTEARGRVGVHVHAGIERHGGGADAVSRQGPSRNGEREDVSTDRRRAVKAAATELRAAGEPVASRRQAPASRSGKASSWRLRHSGLT